MRECLSNEGYSLSAEKRYGERGVDIIAKRDDVTYHVEVIGYKWPRAGSGWGRDFFEAFFHAVSRLDEGAEHVVVAVPSIAESGLRERARHHRIAWIRIAGAFPELEVWLVDLSTRTYRQIAWKDWLEPSRE